MKIALLLSGQIRNGRDIYEFFDKNILNHHDVDVFISVWNDDMISDIIKLYNPISIDIEHYTETFEKVFYEKIIEYIPKLENNANLISIASMWYRTKRVCQLKMEYEKLINTKYDIVIKSRPDLKLEEKLTFEEVKDNTVYIPYGWNWSGGINDLFVYGNSNSINNYCFLFDELIYLLKELKSINSEKILQRYLRTKTFLNIKRPMIDMTLRELNIKSTYNFNELWPNT